MQPPAFAAAGLWRMVSGIDDRLHRLWTQPGQTLRGRVNHRTREPLLKYSQNSSHRNSRIVPSSQYHCDNYEAVELSALRHKGWGAASIGAGLFLKPA